MADIDPEAPDNKLILIRTRNQMQKLIVKILEQKSHHRGLDRRFKLDSQNFVDVQLGLKFQNFRYPVNLLFLDDKPVESTILPWKWIFISVFLTLITLALAGLYILPINELPYADYVAQYSAEISRWTKPVLAGSTVLMLISILLVRRKTQRFIALNTKHGQVPLLKFLQDSPGKNEAQNFIREIRHRIAQVNKNRKHNMEDLLSAELTGLRNLRDHKVLTEKEYKLAKKRIMKKHAALGPEEISKSGKQKLSMAQYQ